MSSSDPPPSSEIAAPHDRPIDRLLRPLATFARHQLAGAGLLMLATTVALAWASSPWHETLHHLLETEVSVGFGAERLGKSLHHWINDGLMAVFFFLVGLEIKRELLVGELSTMRKAVLPAIAAIGGMVVPAGLYAALNHGEPTEAGWGIPMATDIAFALGVLAILGSRVPLGLKVFLTALAIVDDIGAVLVIAVFYTDDVSVVSLAVGLVCLVLSAGLNLAGSRHPIPYLVMGTAAWLAFLESGIHATIAALLMAFTIPARTRIDGEGFVARMEFLLNRLRWIGLPKDNAMNTSPQQQVFEKMNEAIDEASAPLQRIEHGLVAPVTFVILPLFALANAGVRLGGDVGEVLASPLVLGIGLGLVVGKTLGIFGSTWLAVKLKIADLPRGVRWSQILGVGLLGGVGFTMALFVSQLAFEDEAHREAAKLGIFGGSILAAVAGLLVLRLVSREERPDDGTAAESV